MAGRVLMGLRFGAPGFYVSKPGIEVSTASDDDLMLSTNAGNLQIAYSGVISSPSNFNTIAIPDQGFRPIIFYSCMKGIGGVQYVSNSSVIIEVTTANIATNLWPAVAPGSSTPALDGTLYYAVTNIPME